MKIGIDLRSVEAGKQNRGIGRYITSLIEALSEIDNKNEYVFFVSDKTAQLPDLPLSAKFQYKFAHGKRPGLRNIKYVRIIFIGPRPLSIDKYKLDVFFHLDPTQPLRSQATPVVSVAYDLIPYLFKDIYQHVHLGGYTPGHLIGYSRIKLRWRQLELSVQDYAKASRVISISEHTKKDVIKFVPGIDPTKIVTIPLAASNQSLAEPDKIPKSLAKLKLDQFLFYVGGADPRKGLVNLTKCMEEVWQKHPNVKLVIAGKEVTDPDVPEAIKLAKVAARASRPRQIIRLGFISDAELAYLYHHAAAFILPSQYEGFGLPILEAMQAGCPVIAYDNSSIPEVASNAAILVNDGESMAPAINKVLGSDKLRQELITKGKVQAAKFTWAKTAKRTLEVLEQAAKEKRR